MQLINEKERSEPTRKAPQMEASINNNKTKANENFPILEYWKHISRLITIQRITIEITKDYQNINGKFGIFDDFE